MEWLGQEDCVVVLDECHKAKNCISDDDKKDNRPFCPIGYDNHAVEPAKAPGTKKGTESKTSRVGGGRGWGQQQHKLRHWFE
jgi:hypothetical protein